MSMFYTIYGGINLAPESTKDLRALIAANIDKNPYNASWIFHEQGGWSDFAFFGHTINQLALPELKAQMQHIAALVTVDDGYYNYPEGQFRVIYENESCPSYEWILSNGMLSEIERSDFNFD